MTNEATATAYYADPAEFDTDIGRVPVGLRGTHRERYLNLTPDERRVYRYHYDLCGRLAPPWKSA